MRVVQYDVKVEEARKPTRQAWTRTGCLNSICRMLKSIVK